MIKFIDDPSFPHSKLHGTVTDFGIFLQDRAPKIAKLVYKWLNYGLW